ncbi:hypothetical protein FZC84_00070 [Rossellomorea vietnamensis]|uniref:Uncharacterized protein n=1 Tax=Rossellomorea vietnamensis TaxID=218284 RepID=A0A5D4MGV5_9BACI|nr:MULTISPECIES: hypothetical protein [Bacillaceae]TYS01105.1 hypothetical protein FZC84_00070 [Rossellomorea vietnamensis]
MNHSLQMYIQYEIKESYIEQYQQIMKDIFSTLSLYEAGDIQLMSSPGSPSCFTEVITLPTESHYHALKRLRTSDEHPLFGMLDGCISGGLKQMVCFGLKKSS